MFFAHSLAGQDHSKWQSLPFHLRAVSVLTSSRAEKFGAGRLGALVGLLHDLGKYSAEFQAYINGNGASPDHATAGAREIRALEAEEVADRFAALIGAYCIAGHHGGLPNWRGESPLSERLKKSLPALDPTWRNQLQPETKELFPKGFQRHDDGGIAAFQLALLGRMLFSCLVDADYRDTEAFYLAAEGRAAERDWPALCDLIDHLLGCFDAFMSDVQAKAKNTALNRLRADILANARSKATLPRGVFTLNVPTGGGKTLASLGFALAHAKAHDMDRIIYGIPFTSIIDQTAVIFRQVLGKDIVLEHHSAIEDERQDRRAPEQEGERDVREKMRLAMEDWAAPIVVTTNVQLFESLFANRTSRCRKLHNLVSSVIVLDEAQTIPLPLLRPCVAALDELTRNYGCSVVLCTATQPALAAPRFKGGFNLSPERELAPDPTALSRTLQRVKLSIRPAPATDAELVQEIAAVAQALVIVNSRRHALDLYKTAKAAGLTGLIHLTTRQTAADRRRVLAGIRDDLKNNKPCRVIATSLVEAGVDIDFPRVWRAQAGLDQIAQAAGRCNREGRRAVADSIVTVFRPAEAKPPWEIRPFIEALQRAIPHHHDLFSPEAIQRYFNEVYWQKGEKRLDQITVRRIDGSSENISVLEAFLIGGDVLDFPYRAVAEGFRLIESGMEPVIITNEDEARSIIARLRVGAITPGAAARRLQISIVQVPPTWRRKLIDNGHAEFIPGYGMAARNEVPAFGYSTQNIGFLISLNADGSVASIPVDLRSGDGKKKVPRRLSVPQPVKRTSGIEPNFLWDKTAYVLGVTAGEGKRTAAEHKTFVECHRDWLLGTNDEGLVALLRFLEVWRPELFAKMAWPEDMKDQNIVFALERERLDNVYLHDRSAARELWARLCAQGDKNGEAICLISGLKAPVARLHPAIKGVWDAQSSGASIVSFNLDAFTSYGHEQGDNAPISETAAFAYTTALNRLLERDSGHRVQIGDASTVFWAGGNVLLRRAQYGERRAPTSPSLAAGTDR